jgi:hypothetical protein
MPFGEGAPPPLPVNDYARDHMKMHSAVAALCLALVFGGSTAHAYIYNEDVCSVSLGSPVWNVGNTMPVYFTAGALRTTSGYVPVDFYLSPTNTVTSSSIFLKRNSQAYIYQPGPYCSNVVQDTLSLPQTTNGTCFELGNYYVIAKAGNDTMAVLEAIQAPNQPTITGFSPQTAPTGGLVTVTGTNFTAQTYVLFNGVSAPRSILSSTSLVAQVPAGATSGTIRVGRVGTNTNFCNLQQTSPTAFTLDPYCLSTASYTGYGAIDYVATSEFVNDTTGSGTCPNYTNSTQYTVSTTAGQVGKEIDIHFGACGQADYEKLFKMYVDWNGDNDFTDPGEFLIDAPSVSSAYWYTITFSIPTTVLPGTKRIRFITALYDGSTVTSPADVSSCGAYGFGETEDYLLHIAPASGFTSMSLTSELPRAEMKAARSWSEPRVRLQAAPPAHHELRLTLPAQP